MTLADPEQRLPHLQRQTMSLATDLIAWADTYQSENGQSLRPLWRPDSWHRFLSRTAGLKDGAALVQLLTPRDQ
jgi:hypothetical protein